MRASLAYLLTAAIFLHAALGCCWHQGDACAACEDAACQLAHSEAGTTAHRSHKSHCPGHAPCSCRLECQGVCNVVCPKKTELTKATWAAPFHTLAAIAVATPRLALSDRRSSLDANGFAMPLRAHLVLCVLLI